jgi:dCMP deaminase
MKGIKLNSLKAFFKDSWDKFGNIYHQWIDDNRYVERPEWDQYFMSIALMAATRSRDAQTNYGACIIKDRKIIGTGYNSFPRGFPDDKMPNTRPLKYPWMIHAEKNALYNCTSDPEGATVYVNGHPCFFCLRDLYQNGITDYVITNSKCNMVNTYSEEEQANYHAMLKLGQLSIREIEFDSRSLQDALNILEKSK